MKRKLLAILILGSLLLVSCAEETEREDLHFFVAGHVCGGPTDTLGGLYAPFQTYFDKKTRDKSINFGFFTGDIVSKSDTHSWDLIDKAIQQNDLPIYFAPGNQDLKDRALYKKRYGKTNQHFEKGNCLFVIWDVLNNGWNVEDEQLNELLKLIALKRYDNVFIFTHQVIWYDPAYTPQIIPNDLDGKASKSHFYENTIQALDQTYMPIYLFAGDVGAAPIGSELSIHKYKNIRFISSGMGGAKWDNVVDVTVKDGKVSVTIDYLNGNKSLNVDSLYVPIVF